MTRKQSASAVMVVGSWRSEVHVQIFGYAPPTPVGGGGRRPQKAAVRHLLTGPSAYHFVPGAVLKKPVFFFLLRTALEDSPQGPPTANR